MVMRLIIKESLLLEKGSKTKRATTALIRYLVDYLVANPLSAGEKRELDISNFMGGLIAKSKKYGRIALDKIVINSEFNPKNVAYYSGGSITFSMPAFGPLQWSEIYGELKQKKSKLVKEKFEQKIEDFLKDSQEKVKKGKMSSYEFEKLKNKPKPEFTISKTLNDRNFQEFKNPYGRDYFTTEDIFETFEGKKDPEYALQIGTTKEFKPKLDAIRQELKTSVDPKKRENLKKRISLARQEAKETAQSNLDKDPNYYSSLRNVGQIKKKLYRQLHSAFNILVNSGDLEDFDVKSSGFELRTPASTLSHELRHAVQYGDETLRSQIYKPLGEAKYFLLGLPAPFYQRLDTTPYYGGTTAQSGEGIIGTFYYYTAPKELDARMVQYSNFYKNLLEQAKQATKKRTEKNELDSNTGLDKKELEKINNDFFNKIIEEIESYHKDQVIKNAFPPYGRKELILNEIKSKMFYTVFSFMKKFRKDLYNISFEKNEEALNKAKTEIDIFENNPETSKSRLEIGNAAPAPNNTSYK